ncbi:putative formate transporter 1 [invertebrate metagenome]|uniref:Putative formate transporter 1 n=1 Tax=invertebrate metagenome TaxID=1711999 RepID=A0A2H9T606_9ZZZZ
MNDQSVSFEARTPLAMAQMAESIAVAKADKAVYKTFILAVMGGVFIAMAGIFYTVVATGSHGPSALPYGMTKLIGGIAFSVGLILVVLCGAELFTSSTLISIPCASGKVRWGVMFRNWVIVYLGNGVGSLIMVAMILYTGQWHDAHGAIGESAMSIANAKMGHSFGQVMVLGILCNIMVCVSVWASYAARSASGKILAIILPVAVFIASGFEHSVANMYLLPVGWFVHNFADASFWQSVGRVPADFSHITGYNLFMNNLIPATIGNVIGGAVLVGMANWLVFLKKQPV